MITPTARRILEHFAQAYPVSAHYRGGRPLRKSGWEDVMPEIARDVDAKDRFLEAVDELVRAGILSVRWRRFREGDVVEALYLRDPAALYASLGIRSPADTAGAQRAVLRTSDPPANSLAAALAAHVDALLDAGHPTPFANEADLRDTLRLLSLTPDEAAQLPIRALSVRLFSNSKRIEALLRAADTAALASAGVRASEVLGLSRSYPEVTIALWGSITFADGRIWDLHGEWVTLALETVTDVESIEFSGTLVTVENKESFAVTAARAEAGFLGAVVYTAGHPNRAVQAVVRLAAAGGNPAVHFGDMDPEGLFIYQEIAALIPSLQPFFMDPVTYDRFAAHGRPLTAKELSTLDRVTRSELAPLVARMRTQKVAVEQEVIDPAADCVRETEALEWAESTFGDVGGEER